MKQTRRQAWGLLLGISVFMVSDTLWGQERSTAKSEEGLHEALAEALVWDSTRPILAVPAAGSTANKDSNQVTFEGTKDGTSGKATVDVRLPNRFLGELQVSGPINKKTGTTDLVTGAGLPGFYTADLGLTYVIEPLIDEDSAKALIARAAEEKTSRGMALSKALSEMRSAGNQAFTESDLSSEANSGLTMIRNEARGLGKRAMFATLRGQVGRQQFRFAEADTFETRTETLTGWGGTASYGVFFRAGEQAASKIEEPPKELVQPVGVYVEATAQYSNLYKDQEAADICQTISADRLKCDSLPIGAPDHTVGWKGQAEVRWHGPWISKIKVVGGVRVIRDWSVSATRVELPIYFLSEKQFAFTGGLSPYWQGRGTSVKQGMGIAFFVSGTFFNPFIVVKPKSSTKG